MYFEFFCDPIKEKPVIDPYLDFIFNKNYELPMQILFQLEITRKIMILLSHHGQLKLNKQK